MNGTSPAPARWRPTRAELAALEAEHRARVSAADGLAAVADLLPPDADADDLLAVRLPDGSRAVGVVTESAVDEAAPAATWRALHESRLRARAAGPDVAGAVAALVDVWTSRARAAAGAAPPAERGLVVAWPSRDVAAVAALADRGLRPRVHLAARPDTRPLPGAPAVPAGVVLRDATAADVDAVVAHQLAELAYDAHVGAARVRPGARATLAPQVAAAVARDDSTVLVAQAPDGSADGVLGVVAVEPPRLSGAVAGAVVGGPVAYVVLLHVADEARGAGLGTALVDAALARVRDEHGPGTVVLLHHGVLNPLSAPFWARHGFRPVLTTWELPVGATP